MRLSREAGILAVAWIAAALVLGALAWFLLLSPNRVGLHGWTLVQ